MENFSVVGMPSQDEETETATYSKTKRTDKGSVTISANAQSMADLHDVLKLAGITLPKQDEPEQPEQPEPEMPEEEPCSACADDQEVSYSTDKQVLVNYLRDKLKNRLS